MQTTMNAFTQNFLGNAPYWYKQTIIAFLVLNPVLLYGRPIHHRLGAGAGVYLYFGNGVKMLPASARRTTCH